MRRWCFEIWLDGFQKLMYAFKMSVMGFKIWLYAFQMWGGVAFRWVGVRGDVYENQLVNLMIWGFGSLVI